MNNEIGVLYWYPSITKESLANHMIYEAFFVVDRGIEPMKTKENIGKVYC